jgi:hypothetical protein
MTQSNAPTLETVISHLRQHYEVSDPADLGEADLGDIPYVISAEYGQIEGYIVDHWGPRACDAFSIEDAQAVALKEGNIEEEEAAHDAPATLIRRRTTADTEQTAIDTTVVDLLRQVAKEYQGRPWAEALLEVRKRQGTVTPVAREVAERLLEDYEPLIDNQGCIRAEFHVPNEEDIDADDYASDVVDEVVQLLSDLPCDIRYEPIDGCRWQVVITPTDEGVAA